MHNCKFLIGLFVFVVSGCSSTMPPSPECSEFSKCSSILVSKSLTGAEPIAPGVIYSLPRQNAKLTLKNTKVTKALLKKQKEAEGKKLKALEAAYKAHQKVIVEYKALLKKLGESNEVLKNEYTKKQKDAELRAELLSVPISQTQGKLDAIELKILNFSEEGTSYNLSAKLTALTPYADSSVQFAAIVKDSSYTSETIELKTTTSGLLSGGSANTRGNIDEIFIALASAYGAVDGLKDINSLRNETFFNTTKSQPPVTDFELPYKPPACQKQEFQADFDLNLRNEDPLKVVNTYFEANKLCLELSANTKNLEEFKRNYPKLTDESSDTNEKMPPYLDGLVYPRTAPLQVTLKDFGNPDGTRSSAALRSSILSVDIVAPTTLAVLTMKEGNFADHNYEYDFSNGVLTRFKSDRQNEWVSFFNMFPEIAKAIVSIPTELIQLKFDLSSSEKAYYEAQAAILKSQLEYQHFRDNPQDFTDTLVPDDSQ